MSEARCQPGPDGVVLEGELTFETVPDLLECEGQLFGKGDETVRIDLSRIRRSDSAGLALLVAWTRAARRHGCRLRFVAVPAQLLAMARVSGLAPLLGLEEAPQG